MEFLIMLVAWVIPIAAFIFVIAALWQILRAQGEIVAQLQAITRLLEIQRERDRV